MNYDIEQIRGKFPALNIKDSGVRRIYFDNPAGTQVPIEVIEALQKCMIESNANIQGGFETSNRVDKILDEFHQSMADFLNATSSEEIIFGQNMTTLTLHISRSIGRLLSKGDEIILSRMDHDANISPWLLLAEDIGLSVKWLSFDTEKYEFDINCLENLLSDKTKLICIGGASNLLGTINDIKSICKIAKKANALTYIDAVQLAPHVSIDVQDIDCDFLVCSAYKFFGPHQGILWGKRKLLKSLSPYKVRPATSELPGCFETGTQSHEGMAGTTAAVNYFAWIGREYAKSYQIENKYKNERTKFVHAALDYLFEYEKILTIDLIEGLQNIKNVQVQGITEKNALDRRLPTVSFSVSGLSPSRIAEGLAKENIFVWSGHSYALEVVKSLNLLDEGGVLRTGPVHYNTINEIHEFLEILDKLISKELG
jgi:cysteine desulfurase family protein (TIGR01976 family)